MGVKFLLSRIFCYPNTMALEPVQEDSEQANIDDPAKAKDKKYYMLKEALNLQIAYSYSLPL